MGAPDGILLDDSPELNRIAPSHACRRHVRSLGRALRSLEREAPRLEAWGVELAERLMGGARLLTSGNGGSAAEAQHLAAELVGRFRLERRALSALCLHAETSTITAVSNDYGFEQVFARQVEAHGRVGDVLIALSTSGSSANVIAAAEAARDAGLLAWSLTGAAPNALEQACDDAVCLEAPTTATVQDLHLVAIHVLCDAVDRTIATHGSSWESPRSRGYAE